MTEFRTDVQTSKFSYRIDPKPEGGFVAKSSDPRLPAIEGATREEVQQKIQSAITEMIGDQLPTMFKLGNLSVKVNRKVSVTTRTAASSQADLKPGVPGENSLSAGAAPIVPERGSSTALWILAGLMLIAALIYFSYLRR